MPDDGEAMRSVLHLLDEMQAGAVGEDELLHAFFGLDVFGAAEQDDVMQPRFFEYGGGDADLASAAVDHPHLRVRHFALDNARGA